MTLTLDCHELSCTHLFDYMHTCVDIHLTGFNIQLKLLKKIDLAVK